MIPAAYRVPGAAVFWGKSAGSIEHVAYLYEPVEPGVNGGDWYLIEARGVMAGVVKTRLYERKPGFWGWMSKYFDYDATEPTDEAAPAAAFLARGDRGDKVRAMQAALIALGYDLGKWGADGDFGAATEAAVKIFQHDHGLAETGVFGPAALAKLEALTAAEPEPEPTFTVLLRGVSEAELKALREKWPTCEAVEE